MGAQPRIRIIDASRAVLLAAIAVASVFGSPGRAAAQTSIVTNGGFETPAITGSSQLYSSGNTALAPWVIGSGSIKVSRTLWQPAAGAQSIALNSDDHASISQVVPTQAGKSYRLRFKYSKDPTRTSGTPRVTVRWGPSRSGPFTLQESFTFPGLPTVQPTTSNMNWQTVARTVQATSSSMYLSFSYGDDDHDGIALDDVSATGLTMDQATLTVTGPASVTYGTTGTATTSGGSGAGAVTFSAGASTGCAVVGTTVSVTDASGTCVLTATKAGDANYNPATSAPFTVILNKADQATLIVTGPSSMRYGTTYTATATGGSGGGALSFSAGATTGCSVNGTTISVSNASATCVLTATRAGDNNFNATTSAPFPVTLPQPFATPALIRAVATTVTDAFLIGRVDGSATLPITLQVYAAAACTNGVLVNPSLVATGIVVTPDAYGYFGTPVSGVTAGYFVAVQVTTPALTVTSACIASSGDNDTWPKALQLVGSAPTARDYIDAPGKARWYKFDVLPGQRIQVSLSGLPADYDLAVFKDIGATFLGLLGVNAPADLTRLSAEYAPSTFSPSTFSPSTFSPSTFSPDAYTPSTFSPSTFSASVYSPSTFSPSTFSPSTFSPSTFSPSTFSPSTFSPSTFSPSTFSPSTFSPSTFSPDELGKAFSSAQTRSIIGVSATPGTGDELVVVNTWNNTGSLYVRVAGRAGALHDGGQFTVSVAKDTSSCVNLTDTTLTPRTAAAGPGIKTIILTDSSKLVDNGTLAGKLAAFAGRSEINGVVVDVAGDIRVGQLKLQAANNPSCPFATNLVAEEIKGIVDSYRANNPGLRYVVIAGNDSAIPFFRYPDQSLLGQESGYVPPVASNSASEASLRRDFVLSQDAYGSGTRISLRTSSFPVPGLAVGRLVETPAEIAGMIDAYTARPMGSWHPARRSSPATTSSRTPRMPSATELGAGTASAVDTLIAPNNVSPQDPVSWTAADLGTKLFGSRHDVIFLAGHFSANSALAADFATNLITTDLAASTTDFTNSIVFSAGCHSGYNLVDTDAITGVTLPLDWAQAFAQKKATLIAGTGYQYGDTDFLEYSERLYLNFARELRTGTGPVSVGEALVKAKLDYLAATPDIRGIHEKALLEATLFGLPMLGVNMPGTRLPVASQGGAITPAAVSWPSGAAPGLASLGLKSADVSVAAPLTARTLLMNNVQAPGTQITATWWEGPQGVVSNPAEPALPLAAVNVTPTDGTLVLRGVGFRGGVFADDTITPLTGAATDDLRGVHVPFVSPVFFPMRPWTVNYFGALGGTGATSLLVTPAQHRAAGIALGTSTRRTFTNLDLRLFYSGNLGQAALSDAPSIVAVTAQPNGSGLVFTAQVVGDPAAAINQVWTTYTGDGTNTWTPVDLAQCVAPLPAACGTTADSSVWKGMIGIVPANLKYVVQAANGYGLVTFDDNFGAYYTLAGAGQAPTTVALGPVPASATYGDSPTITVTLKSGNSALPGENVIVAIGGAARAGTTDANGVASVTVPLVAVPASYRVIASFGGDTNYLPSSDSAGPIVVAKAPSNISALAVSLTSATATATLTATVGGKPQPLLQEAVTFTLSATPGSPALKTVVVNTDYLGRAPLQSTGLPAGTYALSATFAGNATYSSASAGQSLAIAQQTINFGTGVTLPTTLAYGGAPVTFTVSSDSGLPVTVDLTRASRPYCRLDGTGPTYTLSVIAAPGLCTLEASAGGTTTYTSVKVTQDIAITRGDQKVVFSAPPATTAYGYGDPPFAISVTGSATGNAVTLTPSGACSTATDPSTHVTTVTIIAAGTCTIVADQAGSSYYNAAQATLTYTISTRQVTVTADADEQILRRSRSGADLPDHQRLIGARRQFRRRADPCGGESAGSYAIQQGTLALSRNYTLTYVGANLTITARPVAIAADAQIKVYGAADPALTYKITSGSLAAGDNFTRALTRVAGQSVGTYAITQGTLTLGSNYALTYTGADLTITRRPVTVTAHAQGKVYGAADPTLTYQITSGSLATGDSLAGALARVAGESVAAYAIQQGTLALSGNYTLAYVGANLTITNAATTTALVPSTTLATVGQSVTLTATVAVTTRRRDANRYRYIHGRSNSALGTSALAGGTVVLTTNTLAVGTHSLTASYADGAVPTELPGLDERAGQRDDKQGGHHHDACFRQDVGSAMARRSSSRQRWQSSPQAPGRLPARSRSRMGRRAVPGR